MRKWIVLAFILGFITGGTSLYLAVPVKPSLPFFKGERPVGSGTGDRLAPDSNQDENIGEDLNAIEPGINDDRVDAPQSQLGDGAPGTNPAAPDELPPDEDPDDGIQDLSNDAANRH